MITSHSAAIKAVAARALRRRSFMERKRRAAAKRTTAADAVREVFGIADDFPIAIDRANQLVREAANLRHKQGVDIARERRTADAQ